MPTNTAAPITFKQYRRRAFLIGLPLGAVVAFVALTVEVIIYPHSTTSHVLYSLIAGCFLVLAVLVSRLKEVPRWMDYLLFVAITTFLTVKLGMSLFFSHRGNEAAETGMMLGYWYPVFYALSFILFGFKRGLKASLFLYGITVLLVAYHIVTHVMDGDLGGTHPTEFYMLSQLVLSDGILILLFAMAAQLTHLFAHNANHMERLANTDGLTRVNSRRRVEALLEEELERAQRYRRSLAVVLVDIDYFKQVNDQYGHAVGDKVLREFSSILTHGVRSIDHVGRWGGEEFILILPEIHADEAELLAQRLREGIESHFFKSVGTLTASFGIASLKPTDSVLSLVQRADESLYRAKAEGRNRVVTVSP